MFLRSPGRCRVPLVRLGDDETLSSEHGRHSYPSNSALAGSYTDTGSRRASQRDEIVRNVQFHHFPSTFIRRKMFDKAVFEAPPNTFSQITLSSIHYPCISAAREATQRLQATGFNCNIPLISHLWSSHV